MAEQTVQMDPEAILAASWLVDSADGVEHRVKVTDFLGTPILIYAFTSFCTECLAQLPEILQTSREADFLFLPLCLDEKPDREAIFAAMGEKTILLLGSREEQMGQSVFGEIESVPAAFLLGCKGELLERYNGNLSIQHLSIRAHCEDSTEE